MSRAAPRLLVLLLGIAGTLSIAGPASAHVGGGAAGSDFDGRIDSVRPAMPGVTVRILQFGNDVEIVNASSTEVLVPGYMDEPYLRIGPRGVWRNVRSPATYINTNLLGQVKLPTSADPLATPQWVQISTAPQYVWHDHRTHWMSQNLLPPAVAADPTRSHLVSEWKVPLRYGDAPVTVTGALTWSPPPSPWLVWPAFLALVLLAIVAGALARSARPLAVLMGVGAVAVLWHAAATPAPPATVSSHAAAIVGALLPALIAVLVSVGAIRAARRGRGVMTGLLAVVLGWLFLVEGLPDIDVLWSAHVLSSGPQLPARVAVAVLVALGPGLVVGGVAAARRFREAGAVPAGDEAGTPVPVG